MPVYGNGVIVGTQLLKASGQANVYRGKKRKKDGTVIDVAIKVYKDEKDWEECKEELIEVLDFYEVPKPCYTMLLVEGGDLRDYLDKSGTIQPNAAVHVIRGIAEGLLHLHTHKRVHRDLKSPNVLLRLPSMDPVLIDLGLGKSMDNAASFNTIEVNGTLLWMAPEMIREKAWSTKTEICALGIIMWEVFSGKIPYEDSNFQGLGQLLNHILNNEGRPTLALARNMSVMQSALMQSAWDSDPNKRPTANEFLATFA